jgi:hypothetical protein
MPKRWTYCIATSSSTTFHLVNHGHDTLADTKGHYDCTAWFEIPRGAGRYCQFPPFTT